MLKINADALGRAMRHLGEYEGIATGLRSHGDLRTSELDGSVPEVLRASFIRLLEMLRPELVKLDAKLSDLQLLRVLEDLRTVPELTAESLHHASRDLASRVSDELASRFVFSLTTADAEQFQNAGFSAEVMEKFPLVAYDIDEAGKCLALGRSTAAVFHLMRVMEVALRAVHHCLGINTPLVGNNKNWGNIVNGIRDNIKTRGVSFTEKDHFQELYATLDAVKDSWRNGTMHVQDKKTAEEATMIMVTVRNFMKKIASRMDENGEPKL